MKLSIIVPYRDREKNLKMFLSSWKHFMENSINKDVAYDIWIIEQKDNEPFRFGKCMNIGFLEREKTSDYIFSTGVDFIPKERAYRKLDMFLSNSKIKPLFGMRDSRLPVNIQNKYIGILVGNQSYRKLNGYGNNYNGWGGEDTDFSRHRIGPSKIEVDLSAFEERTIGLDWPSIAHLPHKFSEHAKSSYNKKLKINLPPRINKKIKHIDGVNNCIYQVLEKKKTEDNVYHLMVDFMHEEQDKLTLLPYIK